MSNVKQFNGQYGCLNCLNPGVEIKKNLRIYSYLKCDERTHELYSEQVEVAEDTGESVQGVKGASWFSKFIDFPEACLIDYMHLCLLGTFRALLPLMLDSNNK